MVIECRICCFKTLLYCDGGGKVYHVKTRPYVRKPFRNIQGCKPRKTQCAPSTVKMETKPLKYMPPEHVIQFSPDFSMLSLSKPKRRRKRKGDDSLVWFSDVGSTSFKKRQKCKKKKKKVGLIIICYNGTSLLVIYSTLRNPAFTHAAPVLRYLCHFRRQLETFFSKKLLCVIGKKL